VSWEAQKRRADLRSGRGRGRGNRTCNISVTSDADVTKEGANDGLGLEGGGGLSEDDDAWSVEGGKRKRDRRAETEKELEREIDVGLGGILVEGVDGDGAWVVANEVDQGGRREVVGVDIVVGADERAPSDVSSRDFAKAAGDGRNVLEESSATLRDESRNFGKEEGHEKEVGRSDSGREGVVPR